MIIGITGGSGSGKTTLLQFLQEKGALVLDCDAIYHRLLEEDAALLAAIEARFPGTVTGRQLDRKKLGSIVFAENAALQDLNRITHAAVKRDVQRQLESKPRLAAIDAIGLMESGLDQLCDVTVAVLAPREERIKRLVMREGISEEYAAKRIDAQHKDSWFREKCDYCLVNDSNLDAFATKCLAFWESIRIMEEKQ